MSSEENLTAEILQPEQSARFNDMVEHFSACTTNLEDVLISVDGYYYLAYITTCITW